MKESAGKELTQAIINYLYPKLTRAERRRFVKLAVEKDAVKLDTAEFAHTLDNLLCSVIRHNCTSYDLMIKATSRRQARGAVQPIINARLNEVKRQV